MRAKDEVRLLEHPALVQPVTPDERQVAADILARVGPEQAAAAFARLWREGRSAPEELMDTSPAALKAPAPRAEFGASVWFAVSVGRAGRAEARWLLPKICDAGGITKDSIGAIRVQEDETFVQIAVAEASRFGQTLEMEPGVTMRRIAGEPDLDAPVKARAKPREAKPYEPKPERKVHAPEPLREADVAVPVAAAPRPERAPAPRPLRDDAARTPRKPYDPDRKPYAKRDDAPRPAARQAESDRTPYVKRDSAAPRPSGASAAADKKPYARRDDAAKPYARRADADRKPFAKAADAKPYARRDATDAKPFVKRAEADPAKPRWKAKPEGAAARPAEGRTPGKPLRAAGSKSHGKPAYAKRPAPRATDPSDTSKRFVPPKKPRA